MDLDLLLAAALYEIFALVTWFKEEGRQAALLG
jgi:hypothetical protein